jgi:SAM-dependent methyltransferase
VQHEKYGNVVRVAPNELSYMTKDGWRDIYGETPAVKHGMKRSDDFFAYFFDKQPTEASIVNANEEGHSRLRKIFSCAFSKPALTAQEPPITEKVGLLIQNLKQAQSVGKVASSAPSQRSNPFDFVVKQGRTFHRYREGKYPLPNDYREQERLDFQHHFMLTLLDGKLHLAPIGENPQNVLDIGTGTGIWAVEFADRYPSANVIGTDLSPIQPDFVPKNCFFEIDDAEDEWLFNERFDYIHMRAMMTCFADPRSIIQKAYNQLAPGGYLEMQDGRFPLQCHDDTLQGTALDRWAKACVEAGEVTGRAWNNARFYKQWMEEIGFEVIQEKVFEIPTSNWPKGKKAKELGLWFHEDLMDSLSGSKVLLTKTLGYKEDEVELLLMEVRKNLKDRGVHAYMPV